VFEEYSSTIFIPRHDLQAVLDQHDYYKLFASANIQNQACLTALFHLSGASSGWLKATSQSSLGLTIPGPEFVVGLCLLLGIPLFPVPPLCVCLSPIDRFGDHLLNVLMVI